MRRTLQNSVQSDECRVQSEALGLQNCTLDSESYRFATSPLPGFVHPILNTNPPSRVAIGDGLIPQSTDGQTHSVTATGRAGIGPRGLAPHAAQNLRDSIREFCIGFVRGVYFMLCALAILAGVLFVVAHLGGCAASPEVQAANVRDDTIQQIDLMQAKVTSSQTHLTNAAAAIAKGAAVPCTQPVIKAAFATAGTEVTAAQSDLAGTAAPAEQAKTDAGKAADITDTVDTTLKKEQGNFFSHRQKQLGIIGIIAMVIIGLIAGAYWFFRNASPDAPVLLVIEDIFTAVVKFFGHIITLGLAWIGGKLGTAVATKKAVVSNVQFAPLPNALVPNAVVPPAT